MSSAGAVMVPGRLAVERVRRLLPAALSERVRSLDSTASTQDVLLDGAAGLPDRSVVVTLDQSAGRGRRGRCWQSEPGAVLALSMLGRRQDGPWPACLTLALGAAAARGLRELGAGQVELEWPNDLVVGGRKLGGVLVETRRAGVVVAGIGVNLRDTPFLRGLARPGISLDEVQPGIAPEALVASLVQAWHQALDLFLEVGLAGFRESWLDLDALRGRPIRVEAGGRTVEGWAQGVDAGGRLLVAHGHEQEAFASGDVSVRAR